MSQSPIVSMGIGYEMDENTKIVLLALVQAIVTVAGYYFGYRAGKSASALSNLKK